MIFQSHKTTNFKLQIEKTNCNYFQVIKKVFNNKMKWLYLILIFIIEKNPIIFVFKFFSCSSILKNNFVIDNRWTFLYIYYKILALFK